MWDIPKMWDGGECIIIGGGPSVPRQFGVPEYQIEQVRKKKATPRIYSQYMGSIMHRHIIAVNTSYLIAPWMDVLFFGDDGFTKKKGINIMEHKGLRVTCAAKLRHSYDGSLKFVPRSKKDLGIEFDPPHISWNNNSGAAAINLAVHFGVKRIILLGFDMKVYKDAQHWHNFYAHKKRIVQSAFNKHLVCFPHIAKDVKGKVEILNASPDSAITEFPRGNLKDFL